MNLSELRAAVRSNLLEPQEARWKNTDINRYLNDGQNDLAVAAKARTWTSVAVTGGTAQVAVPSEIFTLETEPLIWEQDGQRYAVRLAASSYPPGTSVSGVPECYWVIQGQIHLYPVPAAAGTLRVCGIVRPTPMASDTDTPYFSDSDEALIAYATWKAYQVDNDSQMLIWQADYRERAANFAQRQERNNPVVSYFEDYVADMMW